MLPVLWGALMHAPLSTVSRSAYGPPLSLRPCARVIGTYIYLYFLRFLHVFGHAKWILLPALVFSIYALALFSAAPVTLLGLFWLIPEWYMRLIFTSNTGCTWVE